MNQFSAIYGNSFVPEKILMENLIRKVLLRNDFSGGVMLTKFVEENAPLKNEPLLQLPRGLAKFIINQDESTRGIAPVILIDDDLF